MESYYDLWKFLHLVTVIAWLGGGSMLALINGRLAAGSDWQTLDAVSGVAARFGKTYFMPLAITTLVTGILLVLSSGGAVEWESLWIVLGFVGVVATAVIGPAVIEPRAQRLREAVAQHGPEAPESAAALQGLRTWNLVNIAILLIVVWAMVFKPGA